MSRDPEHGPLPFREETSDDYAIHAAQTFDVVMSRDGSMALVGSCKRCEHAMEYLIAKDGVTKSWVRRAAGPQNRAGRPAVALPAPADGENGVQMICTCEDEHPGRPADYLGCGAWWNVAVTGA